MAVCLSSLHRIDSVGILKLRNADIELRNGETDIGRKNTRVRLVFRIHIPEPGGHLVSLQVASHPIECCKKRFNHKELSSLNRVASCVSAVSLMVLHVLLTPNVLTISLRFTLL